MSAPAIPEALVELVNAIRERVLDPEGRGVVPAENQACEAQLRELRARLIEQAQILRKPPYESTERSRGDLSVALDNAAEIDLHAMICGWAEDAFRAARALRLGEAREIARRGLRMLDTAHAVTSPPYTPVELPWSRRRPTADEVREHAARYPVPKTPGAGRWLVGSPLYDFALPVELVLDEAGQIRSWTHTEANGERGALLDTLGFEGCRYLPLTASHIPVALLAPKVPVAPDGEPIRHVPTEVVLGLLDASNDPPEARANLLAVVRERDHHAVRIGELQRDASWRQVRSRAIARLLPELHCVECSWSGSVFGPQVDEAGRLYCPRCDLPALAAHDIPGFMAQDLFEVYIAAVEAVFSKRGGWNRVLKAARALTTVTSVGTPEGRGARRASLRAAIAADCPPVVDALRTKLLAEVATIDTDDARAFATEIAEICEGRDRDPKPTWDEEKGRWSCCSMPICVCAAAWGKGSTS